MDWAIDATGLIIASMTCGQEAQSVNDTSGGRSGTRSCWWMVEQTFVLLLLLLRLFVTRKIPSRRPQMCYPAVWKCWCLYTMYHINNNAFSCVLKVVRLQSDIRNAVGKLFHTEGPMLDFKNYELNQTRNIQSVRTQTNIKYRIQNATYKYKYNYAVNKSKSVDWNSQWILWVKNTVPATYTQTWQ